MMTDSALQKVFSGFATKDSAQKNRRVWVAALTTVVLIGFVLRCFLMAQGFIVNADGIFYIWRAQDLMAGDIWNGVSAYWSPLYSFLTGLVGYPIQDFESGGRLVSLLTGTLMIPATYYLATLLFDEVTGVIASLLIATHAALIQASTWVMTEALYGLLFLGIVTTGWLALRDSNIWHWALTGLSIGLAYLTKPEALAFLLLFPLFIFVTVVIARTNARRSFLGFAIASCIAAACVGPYVVFLHSKVGEWTLTKKTSGNTPTTAHEDQRRKLTNDGRQTTMDRIWGDEYLSATENKFPTSGDEVSSPALLTRLDWARILFKEQIVDFLPKQLSVAFLPLIIIGLFSTPWTKFEAARNLYLGAFVFSTLAGYSLAVTNIRYLLPIIPLLLIWTAFGSVVAARWLTDSLTKISAGTIHLPNSVSQAITVIALLLLLTPTIIAKFTEEHRTGMPLEEQRAGLWLRSQMGEGSATIMASHATVAYYAGGNHLFLPEEDVSTIIEYAKRRKTNFIVFNSRRLSVNKQDFPEISSDHQQDLELVYAEGYGEQFKVRIYKVRL